MSRPPVPPKVSIHLLGGRGSGRFTVMHRYFSGRYHPYYNVTCHEDVFPCVRTIEGRTVTIYLDNESPTWFCSTAESNDPRVGPARLIEVPDAMLVVINPANPPSIDGALRARLEHYESAISEADGVLDGVVILKDVGMSWEYPKGEYREEGEATSLNLSPEELETAERKWQEGAERGYELARRLGVEATVACSRKDEGVKEAIEGLAVRVLEKRRADEARKAEEERRRREEELLAAMPWWKRPLARVKATRKQERREKRDVSS